MRNHGRGKRRKYGETGFENWGGYMAAKVSKLQNQFKDEAGLERNGIFSGVAIFVNGYTEPTGEEMKRIMMMHGGTYHHYYSRMQTTHIIASNLPNTKIQSLNTDTIVNPKWITDSVAAEKLLDYKKYVLYPTQNKNQPKLSFQKKLYKNESETSPSLGCSDTKHNDPGFSSESDEKYTMSENVCENISDIKSTSLESEVFVEKVTEANKNLVSDSTNASSKIGLLSTANPNFLSDFYSNSRLHHISTAGAMFKQYVKDLQNKDDNFSGRTYLKKWMMKRQLVHSNQDTLDDLSISRVIMHIDMDCFFVSVGLIKHPELANEPVAVTHATKNSFPKRDEKIFKQEVNYIKKRFNINVEKGEKESISDEELSNSSTNDLTSEVEKSSCKRSIDLIDEKCSMAEIASCSYEARERGVKNGMFLGVALKLCPELKTIPYDFEGYKAVSMDLYDIVASYTKHIEAVSCDEMYVDFGDILKECHVFPLDFAACIREQIKGKTKCPCSVGIGPNMITARMATKKAKPNGQFLLEASQVEEFMQTQPVSDLPGVGWSLQQRLEDGGVKTCGELQRLSLSHLQSTFGGRTGESMYEFCRGLDNRPVNKEHQRKSISAEVNYGIRFEKWSDSEKFLLDLSEEVTNRLSKISMKGRTITLKLKVRAKGAPVETAKFMGHGVCDNVAKSVTLVDATADKQRIYRETLSLLKRVSAHPRDLRGVGIQVSKLEASSSSSVSIKSYFSNAKVSSFALCPNGDADSEKTLVVINVSDDSDDSKFEDGGIVCIPHDGDEEGSRLKSLSKKVGLEIWAKGRKLDLTCLQPTKDICKDIVRDPAKALDVDVLNALPSELRHQVVEEYKARGYFVPTSSTSESVYPSSSPQPGPSRLSSFNPELVMNSDLREKPCPRTSEVVSEKEEDLKEKLDDLSFSQIDRSFLNALPNDIKDDLKKEFQRKKILKEKTQTNLLKLLPVTRRKRGRPCGSMIKGWNGKSSVFKRSIGTHELSKWKGNNEVPELKQDSETQKESRSTRLPETSLKQVTLCGEYELNSIKALIAQWIETCQTPANIDVKILTEFCLSLVKKKDLEKLELVLKFLNRKTNRGSCEWRESFDLILNEVQTTMIKIYKAPLHFSPLASIVE